MSERNNMQGRMTHIQLSTVILQCFNIHADASLTSQLLAGGAGTTYLVQPAGVVLKPAGDIVETELICRIQSQIKLSSKFQVSRPLKSTSGSYFYDGWSASTYIPNVRPLSKSKVEYTLARFAEILDASRAFHKALQKITLSDADKYQLRYGATHVWAHAHRAVWSSEAHPQTTLAPFAPGPAREQDHDYVQVVARLIQLGRRLHQAAAENTRLYQVASQIVHGDIVGGDNILFPTTILTPPSSTPPPPPAIIDLSLTFGPAEYAEGIILADALTWCGIGSDLIDLAGGRTPQRLDMIRRGLLFRCLSDMALVELGNDAAKLDIIEITRTTGMLEALVDSLDSPGLTPQQGNLDQTSESRGDL